VAVGGGDRKFGLTYGRDVKANPFVTVIEILLMTLGALGLIYGVWTAALVAPAGGNTTAGRLVAAVLSGAPGFIVGTVGLAGFGIMVAVDRARRDLVTAVERLGQR